jgi:hypothetical protein
MRGHARLGKLGYASQFNNAHLFLLQQEQQSQACRVRQQAAVV